MFLREKDKTYSSSPTTHTSTKKSNKKHPLVPPLHGLLKSFSVSHLTSIAEPSASEKRPSPLSNLRTLKKIHLPFSSSSPKLAKASSPTSLTSPLARVKPLPSFLSPLLSAASTSTSTSATSPTPSLLFPVDPPSQKNTACLRVHVLYMTVPSSWPVTLNDLYLTLTSTLPTHQDGPSSVSCFTFQYTQDGFWTSDAASWFPILDATRPIQVTCQLHSKKDPSFTLRSTIPFPLYTHLSTFTFSCPSSMSTSSLSLSSKNKTTSWTLPLHVYFQVTFHPTPSSSSSDSSDSSSSTSTTSMLSIQDFELTQYVGRGRFGKVFQVKFKHNQKYYAIKFLKKELALHTKRDQLHLHSEKTILLMIRHPFIVPLKFAFQSEGYLCLVMPFMHGTPSPHPFYINI
ncbi:hypothetical protein HMI55_004369 [Coelomomyces lativittatus]|nr:hypothetical protein HMI55_004369 [Coelomomyces lativittatus]KAJ1500990.1 hypothetical protein HMI56_003499 [Coelomomyces lativittatus]